MGIVSLGMNLRDVVARWAAFVTEISEHKYGHAPLIKVTTLLNVVVAKAGM